MILGEIIGKTSTTEFKFKISRDAKKYQYVKIKAENNFVLAQIIEIEMNSDETIASCIILGCKEDTLKPLRFPLNPGTKVEEADEPFINSSLGLEEQKGAFLGTLEYTNLKVNVDLNKLLTKHIAIIAKSGSGKSYTASCLIEEILDRNIPLVIIDPHAEYTSLKKPNTKEKEKLKELGLEPKDYSRQVQEYTPDITINPDATQLKLSISNMSSSTLLHLLPAKLSNMQTGLLYSSLQNLDKINFDDIIISLDTEETHVKYTLMNLIEQIKKLNIFSESPTPLQEIVQPGKCSIMNLKGIPPEISEVVVYKLVSDLFEARKFGDIPPFFLVLEEAQNFAPERSFGEAKSSSVLRKVLAEGRKFGLGVALISQRPSRLDKSCISQCSTQIILKVTNPNDLRSITASVEGITSETEKEIKNLPIGTALLVGVVSQPLFINVRPRKSEHGGQAIDIVGKQAKDSDLQDKDGSQDLLPVIKQKTSLKDLELSSKKEIKEKEIVLVPCLFVQLQKEANILNILINLNDNKIIIDLEHAVGVSLPAGMLLSESQLKILKPALQLKRFTPAELFNKSRLQFSEIYDAVKNLTEKGLLVKENNIFSLNKQLQIFSDIEKYLCNIKPDYAKIKYDRKLEAKFKKEDLVRLFSQFFQIVSSRECFLEYFRVIYKESKETG
ncbi:ATP-binding protein [Candidatus Woesearchaeota archaeon]|nr:ATP-binding protein [Candidatus Woesearchaeota archaeon]